MPIDIDEVEEGIAYLSSIVDEEIVEVDEDNFDLSAQNVDLLPNEIAQISVIGFGLIWDSPGEKVYETGIDRGVLYLPDGSALPWNGLTSVSESSNEEVSSIYYDGMKINDLVTPGNSSAVLKAMTYPDEFLELEGLTSLRRGFYAEDQKPKSFGLSYRTLIGNDLQGTDVGYKIHIWYNVVAIPHEKTYNTLSSETNLTEFEWDIFAVPEEIAGINPTAHYILNSMDIDPWLLEEIEELLYGNLSIPPSLTPMTELIPYIRDWARLKIVDNGDGTWTAISARESYISFTDVENTRFEIVNADAHYLDDYTYTISNTEADSDIS